MLFKPDYAIVLLLPYLFSAFWGNRTLFPKLKDRLLFTVPTFLSLFFFSSHRDDQKAFSRLCSVLAVIFLILSICSICPLNTQIGSRFEMEQYTEEYYIMASADGGTTFTKTTAIIERDIEEGEGYFVKSCRIGNRQLVFSENLWAYDTKPEKETYLLDRDGNEWVVILTTAPARQITKQFNWFNCFCGGIYAFTFISFAVAAFKPHRCFC